MTGDPRDRGRAIRWINLNRLAASPVGLYRFREHKRLREGVGLIEKLENLNTLVGTAGTGREGERKRRIKTGKVRGLRLAW